MRLRTLHPFAALLAVLAAAGCDWVPTGLPRYDTVWEFTLLSDSVRTVDLLPDEMSVDERGFVLDGWTFDRSVRLDEVCELCTCFDGPIPELQLEPTDWRIQLPGGLFSAPLSSGIARLTLTNRMGFDLLVNEAGRVGVLRVEILNGTGPAAQVLLSSESTASFPTDSTLVVDFDLSGIELTPSLIARVSGTTPGTTCQNLSLDPEDGIDAFIELRDVIAPEARVVLQDSDLRIEPTSVELPGFVVDRLRPRESELLTSIRIGSRLPAAVELLLSVSTDPALHRTEASALTTPVELGAAPADAEARFDREFLIDVARLGDAETLHFESVNRVVGNRIVTLTGGEQVTWDVRVRATLPSR